MAIIDTCNPCKCPGGYVDKETYRSSVIALLCKLVGEGTSGIMYDFEILCDSNSNEPKIVRYKYEAGSTSIIAEAYNLDGTPYTGSIDDLGPCGGTSSSTQEMIDTTIVGGETVKIEFLRTYYKNSSGSIIGYEDTDLVGQSYTPTGIVSFADRVVTMVSQKEIINTTDTTATITVEENTRYYYSQPLTSLTLTSVDTSTLESEIEFYTDSTFSFTASTMTGKWVDGTPTFDANKHYVIAIKNGIGAYGEII